MASAGGPATPLLTVQTNTGVRLLAQLRQSVVRYPVVCGASDPSPGYDPEARFIVRRWKVPTRDRPVEGEDPWLIGRIHERVASFDINELFGPFSGANGEGTDEPYITIEKGPIKAIISRNGVSRHMQSIGESCYQRRVGNVAT